MEELPSPQADDQPPLPNEDPTPQELFHHKIESALLLAATAGNVACAGLSMAVAVREAASRPDRDRSFSNAVTIAGLGVAAAVTGRYAEKLKASVDTYNDRFRDRNTA